jgi:hypothetical protein
MYFCPVKHNFGGKRYTAYLPDVGKCNASVSFAVVMDDMRK